MSASALSPLDECADRRLDFDDIAVATLCLYTDLEFCEKAKNTCAKMQVRCGGRFPNIRRMTCDALEGEVGFDGLYNKRVEEMVDEFGYTKFVDRWGAKCWVDSKGSHCGDDSGFYPWYADEEKLRKDLEEGQPAITITRASLMRPQIRF